MCTKVREDLSRVMGLRRERRRPPRLWTVNTGAVGKHRNVTASIHRGRRDKR